MILKKTIQNEKTVYAPITFEEAIKDRDEKDDLIFTDDDEKKNFDDILAQIEKAESQATNESEKNDQSASVDGDDEDDDDTLLSWDTVKSALKQAGQFAKKGIHVVDASLGNLFSGLSGEKSKKANKLMQILPFLDDEDVHEIVEDILSDPTKYDGLNLSCVMPFLDEKDCDALFLKIALDADKKYEHSLVSLAPFVSEECLSKLVDKFVSGELQDVDMDGLYPFLSSKDVKRLFKYIVSKKDEK